MTEVDESLIQRDEENQRSDFRYRELTIEDSSREDDFIVIFYSKCNGHKITEIIVIICMGKILEPSASPKQTVAGDQPAGMTAADVGVNFAHGVVIEPAAFDAELTVTMLDAPTTSAVDPVVDEQPS
ncbi:hypothetical protein OPIT5_08160 [Opitutaceae bacterium TAV5]|nr:hypothetical protein OPIT5_08160 [Opitutaceae bacterium TAV5]